MKSKKGISTLIKITVPLIALVTVILITINSTSGDKFSVARYVIVNLEGVNGRAEATLGLDEVGLRAALETACGKNYDEALCERFIKSITYECDRTEGIGNGDVLVITTHYDEDIATKLKLNIGSNTKKYTASGLIKGVALDAFKDIRLVTSGISPYITVRCENNSSDEYLKNLQYDIDKTDNVRIGDTVTIRCRADVKDAAQKGFYFEELTRQYVVQGMDRYIEEPGDIDRKVIDDIVKEASDAVTAMVNDTTTHMSYEVTGNKSYLYRDGNEEVVNLALYKAELINNITGYAGRHGNYLLVTLKGQIRIPDYSGGEDPYEYIDGYFGFLFSDAIITRDGKFSMLTDNMSQRCISGNSYDSVKSEINSLVGPGFDFIEIA